MTTPTLLPPSAGPLVRDLEQATARIGDVPVPIGTLWNPDACPEAALPWLAWALGVEAWDPNWQTDTKRKVIRHALRRSMQRGTPAAVREVLESFGAAYTFNENTPKPQTCQIQIHNAGEIHADDLDAIPRALAPVWRASIRCEIVAGFGGAGGVVVGAAAQFLALVRSPVVVRPPYEQAIAIPASTMDVDTANTKRWRLDDNVAIGEPLLADPATSGDLNRIAVLNNRGPGAAQLRLFFADSMSDEWKASVAAVTVSQGALSVTVPGPTHPRNQQTDVSRDYYWTPPAGLDQDLADFFFSDMDRAADWALTLRTPSGG